MHAANDVENVASAGANPAASTNLMESKPQQTGTRLLTGYGEVATTSGSTSFRQKQSAGRKLPRRSAAKAGQIKLRIGMLIFCLVV